MFIERHTKEFAPIRKKLNPKGVSEMGEGRINK